jgi:hypothetical protein
MLPTYAFLYDPLERREKPEFVAFPVRHSSADKLSSKLLAASPGIVK